LPAAASGRSPFNNAPDVLQHHIMPLFAAWFVGEPPPVAYAPAHACRHARASGAPASQPCAPRSGSPLLCMRFQDETPGNARAWRATISLAAFTTFLAFHPYTRVRAQLRAACRLHAPLCHARLSPRAHHASLLTGGGGPAEKAGGDKTRHAWRGRHRCAAHYGRRFQHSLCALIYFGYGAGYAALGGTYCRCLRCAAARHLPVLRQTAPEQNLLFAARRCAAFAFKTTLCSQSPSLRLLYCFLLF